MVDVIDGKEVQIIKGLGAQRKERVDGFTVRRVCGGDGCELGLEIRAGF